MNPAARYNVTTHVFQSSPPMNPSALIRAALAIVIASLLGACAQSSKKVSDQRLPAKVWPKKGRSYLPNHDVNDQNTKLISYVGSVPVYRHTASNAVLWKYGLNVDADGSPFAYSPNPGQGLDWLADAGHPGEWWALVTDNGRENGRPLVQKNSDPAPGYYISTTSLQDPAYPQTNTKHWVNVSKVPFIVLPLKHHDFGGRLGDYGAVVHLTTGKVAYVIAADLGPPNKLGEGSVALAKALGVNPSAKDGGVGNGVAYIFFPNSGDGTIKTASEIAQAAEANFKAFGGAARLRKLLGVN
jgi:hypothetical protein